MKHVYVILYEDFTALDVFGPVEVLSNLEDHDITFVSLNGGIIRNKQGIRIETEPVSKMDKAGILLIPGGFGNRRIIKDPVFIKALGDAVNSSDYTLCVCTGSALAAETGALDGGRATSNKIAFDWVADNHPGVEWDREARWVKNGRIYTSAGVSAGIDMALGFVRDLYGAEKAEEICRRMEYHWNSDADHDSF